MGDIVTAVLNLLEAESVANTAKICFVCEETFPIDAKFMLCPDSEKEDFRYVPVCYNCYKILFLD